MTTAAQPNPAPAPSPAPKLYVAKDMFGGPDYVVEQGGARRAPSTRSGTRILTREEYDQLMKRKWLSVRDTAAVLGVSDQAVYNYIDDGQLKAFVKSLNVNDPHPYYNIPTEQLAGFIESRHVGARILEPAKPKATP